jgi:hypothetical protein
MAVSVERWAKAPEALPILKVTIFWRVIIVVLEALVSRKSKQLG